MNSFGFSLLVAASLLAEGGVIAAPQDRESRPRPGPYQRVWREFYHVDEEPLAPASLVKGGKKMVPYICQAVHDRHMFARLYAIVALGELQDRRAIPTLENIYAERDEHDAFRGEALNAIFKIDRQLGTFYARQTLALGPQASEDKDFCYRCAKMIVESPEKVLHPFLD